MRLSAARGGRATTRGTARTLLVAALALLTLAWLGSGMARAAFPGENGRIAFASAGAINVIEPDGTGRTFLTCGDRTGEPAWSPDGKRIAFTTTTREDPLELDVETMRADGTGRARIVKGAIRPTWSPDGQALAFAASSDPRTIGLVNADGTDVRALGQGDAPAWSPDGDRIAFERGGDLWTMRSDGTDQTQLAEVGFSPAWSPDGDRIAFIRFGDLWTMNADGSDEARLGADVSNPAWSSDGRRIAFDRGVLRRTELRTMNADGSDSAVLTFGFTPDWQPRPDVDLPPRQFCFAKLRRNTRRGIARLPVRVAAPGRVVLQRQPGVKRFAQAHRGEGPGRVVLRVRPLGWAQRLLSRAGPTLHRVQLPVRAQVTFRPEVGEPRTKTRRVWLVRVGRR